jgi:hypothetical protein
LLPNAFENNHCLSIRFRLSPKPFLSPPLRLLLHSTGSYDNLRGQAASAHVAEIQAAQERHNAELANVTEQSTLKVAKRYASGRPR